MDEEQCTQYTFKYQGIMTRLLVMKKIHKSKTTWMIEVAWEYFIFVKLSYEIRIGMSLIQLALINELELKLIWWLKYPYENKWLKPYSANNKL